MSEQMNQCGKPLKALQLLDKKMQATGHERARRLRILDISRHLDSPIVLPVACLLTICHEYNSENNYFVRKNSSARKCVKQ